MLIGAFLAGTSVVYVAYRLINHDTDDWWLSATNSKNKSK